MLNDTGDARISEANAKKHAQDKRIPFLINTSDARLMPNTPLIRKMVATYVPYTGAASDSLEVRRAFLASSNGRKRVVNSAADEPELVDIGKLSKDDLVAYAITEHGFALDPSKDVRALRKELMAVVNATPQGEALS